MADLTVLYEDFEGTFPGAWTVEDRDEWNGVDHWGSTAYRAFAGTSSAWSAAVGTQVLAPETIWYEDFEGSFPGTNWTVWDSNPAGGDDHWGVTSYRLSSGSWSAWVAEVGDNSVLGSPNNVVHQYDTNMDAYLTRGVDLTGYAYGELSYAYWIDSESTWDALYAGFLDGGVWTFSAEYTGPAASWDFDSVAIPSTATAVGFSFVSDGSAIREGAYIDDVGVVGRRGTPIWSEDFEGAFPGADWAVGDSNPTSGDDYWGATTYRDRGGSRSAWAAEVGDNSVVGLPNNVVNQYDVRMDAFMTRSVNLTGTGGAYLTYWRWINSADFLDYLDVGYNDPTSGWVYWDYFTGYSNGWTYRVIPIPPTATEVGFLFHSDSAFFSYEGAYVDDVALWERTTTPNADIHKYDASMDAWMYHSVDLAGFTSAWMTYAYWDETVIGLDYFEVVWSDDGLTWTYEFLQLGGVGGWEFGNVTIPTTAAFIGFHFYSYVGGIREGVYVDEVTVTGTAPDLSCTASVGATTGTEGQTLFDFTADGSGGVLPYTYAWAFLDGGTSTLQAPSYTYSVSGTYGPSATVTDDVGQTCIAAVGSVTVAHAGPLTVTIVPATYSQEEWTGATYTAIVRDENGHVLTSLAAVTWSVAPLACGSMTPAGTSAGFVADADAGSRACTITASATAAGLFGSGTASVEVVHAGPITVELTPATGAVDEGGALALTVVVRDAGGHDITGSATVVWSVSPGGCGTLSGPNGSSTTFTSAGGRGGTSCTVTASATFGTNEGDDAAVVTVRAGVLAGVLPLLVLMIIAVIVVTVLLMVLRRRRGKPGPAFDQMQPIAPIATRPEDPPLTER